MPVYTYRVRDADSKEHKGVINGTDATTVATELRSTGYYVLDIKEEKIEPIQESQQGLGLFPFLQKIQKTDIIALTRQIAAMSASGIPITSILKNLAEPIRNKQLKDIVLSIRDDIEEGKNLSEALNKYPDIFDPFYINMVKMGEASGNLDEIMNRIVTIEEEEMSITNKIKAAVTYPVILLVVAICVISFLLIFILPKFIGIFETYEMKLPITTALLLGTSLFVQKYWILIVGVLSVFGVWFRYYIKRPEGRKEIDRIILKLPIFGQLILKISVARFARSVSGLIGSGITLLEALSIVEGATENRVVRDSLVSVRGSIAEGKNFAETMRATALFPAIVIQMVAAGESTGRLDQMLMDLSKFYDTEVELAIKSMTVVLEPVLLIFMGGMVAFIALSVLLPIFNLIKIFKQ